MKYENLKTQVNDAVKKKGEDVLERAMGTPVAPIVYAIVDEAHEGLVRVVDRLEPAISVAEEKKRQLQEAWRRIRTGEVDQTIVFEERKLNQRDLD